MKRILLLISIFVFRNSLANDVNIEVGRFSFHKMSADTSENIWLTNIFSKKVYLKSGTINTDTSNFPHQGSCIEEALRLDLESGQDRLLGALTKSNENISEVFFMESIEPKKDGFYCTISETIVAE